MVKSVGVTQCAVMGDSSPFILQTFRLVTQDVVGSPNTGQRPCAGSGGFGVLGQHSVGEPEGRVWLIEGPFVVWVRTQWLTGVLDLDPRHAGLRQGTRKGLSAQKIRGFPSCLH